MKFQFLKITIILGGKMSFADFLEVMHLQTRAEDLPKEVIDAFQAADKFRTGTIPARQLAHMLLHWGEQLSNKEGWSFITSLLQNIPTIIV